jgi:hypothetical protein
MQQTALKYSTPHYRGTRGRLTAPWECAGAQNGLRPRDLTDNSEVRSRIDRFQEKTTREKHVIMISSFGLYASRVVVFIDVIR